jgi:RimJ/RimL family protein N-acetyltransferase
MGFEMGETGMSALPFGFLQEPKDELEARSPGEVRRERKTPILETERLMLRAPRPEDIKAISVQADDRRIAENTARIPHPFGVDDAERFIATANKRASEACFVITLDDTLIGACGVDPREDGPEIGYWLGASYWRHGYATEAVRVVIDHAFGDLQHEALQAGARVSNPASRRVLEKCAFQWIGVRLSRIRAINSAAPVDRFRLDRELWVSLKHWGPVRRVA